MTASPEERFLERTEPLLWSGCLIWKGARTGAGYGTMRIDGKAVYMHRWAYERKFGPIPEGKLVDHTCHQRLCVSADHLRLATRQQNAQNRAPARHRELPRGVSEHRPGRFVAQLTLSGRNLYLGSFGSPREAGERAESERRRLFGEFSGGA